jgi:hypothetical protein
MALTMEGDLNWYDEHLWFCAGSRDGEAGVMMGIDDKALAFIPGKSLSEAEKLAKTEVERRQLAVAQKTWQQWEMDHCFHCSVLACSGRTGVLGLTECTASEMAEAMGGAALRPPSQSSPHWALCPGHVDEFMRWYYAEPRLWVGPPIDGITDVDQLNRLIAALDEMKEEQRKGVQ